MMGRRYQCFASLCLFMLSNLWLSIGVSASGSKEVRIVHEGYEVPHTRPQRKILAIHHKDFEAPTIDPTRVVHEDYEGPHTHPPRGPPTEHEDSYEQAEPESENEIFSSKILSQEMINDYGPPRPDPKHTPPPPEQH